MLVYEILNNKSERLTFVKSERIACELCLANKELSYRPIFVAENISSAEIELKNCE